MIQSLFLPRLMMKIDPTRHRTTNRCERILALLFLTAFLAGQVNAFALSRQSAATGPDVAESVSELTNNPFALPSRVDATQKILFQQLPHSPCPRGLTVPDKRRAVSALEVSSYERNIFYYLTTINAP